MTGNEFDMVLVGGRVGGATAARNLASAGLSVALVEDRLIGGGVSLLGLQPDQKTASPDRGVDLAKAVPGVRETISGDRLNVGVGQPWLW